MAAAGLCSAPAPARVEARERPRAPINPSLGKGRRLITSAPPKRSGGGARAAGKQTRPIIWIGGRLLLAVAGLALLAGPLGRRAPLAGAIYTMTQQQQPQPHQQQQQQQPHRPQAAASQLGQLDAGASSSSFGEPLFRLEPPAQVAFSSAEGVSIPCLASGRPRAQVSWFAVQSSSPAGAPADGAAGEPAYHARLPVLSGSAAASTSGDDFGASAFRRHARPVAANETLASDGRPLRRLLNQGSLLWLAPFEPESEFRADVHASEYVCVAANELATIHSRGVQVQAVPFLAEGAFTAKVNDEFVALGALAVLKCRAQLASGNAALAAEFVQLLEWFTSDGLRLGPGETGPADIKGNKFAAFKTGELHVIGVDMADLRRSYGCRLRNSVTGQLASSSGSAQLILTDPSEASAAAGALGRPHATPLVLHSQSQLIGADQAAAMAAAAARNAASLGESESAPGLRAPRSRLGRRAGAGDGPASEAALMIPCAARRPAGLAQAALRWYYLAPGAGQPVPIEQLAGQRGLALAPVALAQLSGQVAPAGSASSAPLANSNANNMQAYQQQQQQQMGANSSSQAPQPRILVGASHLSIERPVRSLSGRYLAKLDAGALEPDTVVCDTNVIVRQPLRARLEARLSGGAPAPEPQAASLGAATPAPAPPPSEPDSLGGAQPAAHQPASWLSRASGWLFQGAPKPAGGANARQRRHARHPSSGAAAAAANPLLESDARLVQVRGPASVEPPPVVLVGARLQLDCRTQGHPVDGVRWFRDGLPIDTQSAADFQLEIRQWTANGADEPAAGAEPASEQAGLVSSLIVRQVQPRDVGLRMFECFAHNSLGERARSGLAVLVLEGRHMEAARSSCAGGLHESEFASETLADAPESDPSETGALGWARLRGPLNPWHSATLLEGESAELSCPLAAGAEGANNGSLWGRLEWSRLAHHSRPGGAGKLPTAGRNFNQLFGSAGDSRFVINGSSLQIRAISRRQDEALYVCSSSAGVWPGAVGSQEAPTNSPAAHDEPPRGVNHQSSLASQLEWPLCGVAPGALARSRAPMSSVNIRIVAKPKIDPFEFSRNLEEGMRAVVVCTVVSGESPVELTWFKDGLVLAAVDEAELSIDQANGFSSTLTFMSIRPAHSGVYTCVAANAFAATNHSSRLLVNVAPYFIEAPKNTRAVLNSNVLVNCRAGGQPNPQIRWRKLVTRVAPPAGAPARFDGAFDGIAAAANPEMAPPLVGGGGGGAGQLAAPTLLRQTPASSDFRIVTSNSHIQILENGSMIIKQVELTDATRYVCQAFNGVSPSLSEAIDLTVLSPAQFEVNYETVSVKRDAMVKFNCAPKGDQPMQLEWHKENTRLLAASSRLGASASRYSELAIVAPNASDQWLGAGQQRHSSLVLAGPADLASGGSAAKVNGEQEALGEPADELRQSAVALRSSELIISYVERSDTGNFVCVARNAYGKDELTYRLVVQEAPDAPLSLALLSAEPTSLRLSWLAPFDGNLPISHYVIEHRRAHDATLEWSRLVAAANKLSSSMALASDGWLSAAGPSLGLSAGGEPGAGKLASPQQLLFAASAPNANMSTPASVAPSLAAGLPLTGAPATQFSVYLRQLQPRTKYQVRLAAANALGQGAFSAHLTATTAEEPPTSRPNDVRAQPVSSSSIRVLWRGPSLVEDAAPIKGYHVSYRRLTESAGPPSSGAQQQSAPAWLGTLSISATNTSTSAGYLTAPPLPTTLDVASPPTSGFNKAAPAHHHHHQQQQQQQQLQAHHQQQAPSYEMQLAGLDKNTKYEIRVQAYNLKGVGPASDVVGQTLKFDRPGQPTLKLLAARHHSLELRWTIPEGQPLMGFSLFYKCEYDEWQEIQLAIIYHYVIDNLRCGNKYQIYLSGFNQVGRSDPSEVLSVRTEGSAPIAPDKSQFFRSNMSEVVLDMSGWKSGGCPISSFMIQFKRLHDKNWFILSEGSTPFASSDRITIPDLTPGTWYTLMVTALNEAGTTNAEYLFSTLTINGDHPAAPFDQQTAHDQQAGWSGRNVISGLNEYLLALASPASEPANGGASTAHSQQAQLARHQQLLLPVSCILLLLVTSLASYLYYSRASGRASATTSATTSEGRAPSPQTPSPEGMGGAHKRRFGDSLQRHHEHQQHLHQQQQQQQHHHHNHHNHYNSDHLYGYAADHARHQDHHLTLEHGSGLGAGLAGVDQLHQSSGAQSADTPQHTSSSIIDSLLGAGHSLQPLLQQEAPRGQRPVGMRLFSATNGAAFSGGATNSSASTNSTGCAFDASSSQGSSSGASGGPVPKTLAGAKQLHLINESSMMGDSYSEADAAPATTIACPPSQHQQPPPQQQPHHVDLVAGCTAQSSDLQPCQAADFSPLNRPLACHASGQPQRLMSSSFTSAVDLLQRQQQHHHHQQHQQHAYCQSQQHAQQCSEHQQQHEPPEPVYQRLDRSFGAVAFGLQSAGYKNRSQTLRFGCSATRAASDEAAKSQTLLRPQASLEAGNFCAPPPMGAYLDFAYEQARAADLQLQQHQQQHPQAQPFHQEPDPSFHQQ